MKASQTDILIVPGYKGPEKNHWQTRWACSLETARFVHVGDLHKPVLEEWKENLLRAVMDASRPVVLIGYSIGCQVIIHASRDFEDKVLGAFLVAPPDVENKNIRPRHLLTFGPCQRESLDFPSFTIASRNDPFCTYEKAEKMAAGWGSLIIDAGQAGHINSDSGHGPWPEGLMIFAKFMSGLRGDPS